MNGARVAFISYHACPLALPGAGKAGGMNVHVRNLATALGEQGLSVDIFTREHPDHPDAICQVAPSVRVIHLPGGHPDTPLEFLFDTLPEFLAAAQGFQERHGLRYSAIHSHYWLSGWVGQRWAERLSIPHIITFHTLSLIKLQSRAGEHEPDQRTRSEKELMTQASRLVAFSPHERDAMIRLYDAPAERIELVPCGVDLDLFHPVDRKEARQRLGLNGGKVLLYVGRVEPLKGVDLLLQTAARLETCCPTQVLVVGGDTQRDAEIQRLRELAESLKITDTVEFVGRVEQRELPFYYSAADVCVVPSFYESFGMAALEAMACGTPVIASRVGGLPTIVQHGRTGYLKAWRCPEAFANTVEMLISNESLLESLGMAARRRAEGMGWERVAERIRQLYGLEPALAS